MHSSTAVSYKTKVKITCKIKNVQDLIKPGRHMPGFLKILLSMTLVCVHPWGYKLHSCDIEPVQPTGQVYHIQKCNEAILCMGMAFVTKHIECDRNQPNKVMLPP